MEHSLQSIKRLSKVFPAAKVQSVEFHQQWSSLHTRQGEDFVSWQLMPRALSSVF